MASTTLRKRGPGRPPKVLAKRGPGRPPSAETLRKRLALERAAKRLEALTKGATKRGPGRPRKDETTRPRKTVTRAARAARKRNAVLGGRPGRVCLHCLAPVLGGHRDKRQDERCGHHGFAWRPPSGLAPAEIRTAITDEIAALYASLYRLDSAGAAPAPVAARPRARKAAPARQDGVGEAIGPPAIPEATSEAEAATGAATGWRGYDANGECLDCDEPADSHAADCPFWRTALGEPFRTTEAEAPHTQGL